MSESECAVQRHGIVLGAGGSLAWVYHLGVLDGLRDSGWLDPTEASRVVATSAGAAVGAALVAGTSTVEFLDALAATATSGFLREIREARAKGRRAPAVSAGRHDAPQPSPTGRRIPVSRVLGAIDGGILPTSAMIHLPIGAGNGWDRRLWVPAVRVRDGATVVFVGDDRM